jgi:hypothetical protein
LLIVRHGGGDDAVHAQQGLAHGQGTSPSCHAPDEHRDGCQSRLLPLGRWCAVAAPE